MLVCRHTNRNATPAVYVLVNTSNGKQISKCVCPITYAINILFVGILKFLLGRGLFNCLLFIYISQWRDILGITIFEFFILVQEGWTSDPLPLDWRRGGQRWSLQSHFSLCKNPEYVLQIEPGLLKLVGYAITSQSFQCMIMHIEHLVSDKLVYSSVKTVVLLQPQQRQDYFFLTQYSSGVNTVSWTWVADNFQIFCGNLSEGKVMEKWKWPATLPVVA